MCVYNENYILNLKFNTWTKDIDGVYDHKSNDIKSLDIYINDATYIVRTNNNNIKRIEQHSDIQTKEGDELLFHINNGKNDCYKLINPIPYKLKLTEENIEYLNNKLWYILKSDSLDHEINNDDYYLCENDIIKLGSLKYAVQEIHIEQKDNIYNAAEPAKTLLNYDINNLNKNSPPVFDYIYEVKDYYYNKDINIKPTYNGYNLSESEIKKCKICSFFESKNNELDDPLISLCECSYFLHYICLRKEINKRIIIEDIIDSNIVKSIKIKEFECEICKCQLPLRFKLPNINKIFYLIEFIKPINCDYIILESLNFKKEDIYIKSIHIISLLKEYIFIGRDNENDLMEIESSISRKHAILKYNKENGNILIENRSSKYGTLVLIRKPIQILERSINIQVGRTIIEASLMKIDEFQKLKNTLNKQLEKEKIDKQKK